MTALRHLYMSRSAAVRAARNACKAALESPIYQAFEGPDYAIHPTTDMHARWGFTPRGGLDLGDRFFFELRGPALDAVNSKAAPNPPAT